MPYGLTRQVRRQRGFAAVQQFAGAKASSPYRVCPGEQWCAFARCGVLSRVSAPSPQLGPGPPQLLHGTMDPPSSNHGDCARPTSCIQDSTAAAEHLENILDGHVQGRRPLEEAHTVGRRRGHASIRRRAGKGGVGRPDRHGASVPEAAYVRPRSLFAQRLLSP